MSYDENFMSITMESWNEASAAHQMELDTLWRIGNQYDIAVADMALLCQISNISVSELMNYSGKPA